MTALERVIAVLERARVAGGWIDEQVAADVLAELCVPDEAMIAAGTAAEFEGQDTNALAVWRAMIEAARRQPGIQFLAG
jgi:hypothetical protein